MKFENKARTKMVELELLSEFCRRVIDCIENNENKYAELSEKMTNNSDDVYGWDKAWYEHEYETEQAAYKSLLSKLEKLI